MCNPPYVISPESAFLFRDSGMEGDAVSRHVVEGAGAFLEEGAFAQMLVSWVVAPGDDWSAAPRSWVDGSGCDAWLLHDDTVDPLTQAGAWLRHEARGDADAYAAALDRWLAYFDRLGIEAIAVGAVILRRRKGANWVLADELPSDRLGPASDHILRVSPRRTSSRASPTSARSSPSGSGSTNTAASSNASSSATASGTSARSRSRSRTGSASTRRSTAPPPACSPGSTASERSARSRAISRASRA